jgi:hypothetical protein
MLRKERRENGKRPFAVGSATVRLSLRRELSRTVTPRAYDETSAVKGSGVDKLASIEQLLEVQGNGPAKYDIP